MVRNAIATCAVLLGLVLADTLRTDAQAPQGSDPRTRAPSDRPSHPGPDRRTIVPSPHRTARSRTLINQYCVACHNDRLKSGGMTLTALNLDDAPPERRDRREGDSQAARWPDAAGWREAPGWSGGRRVRLVAREQDRHRGDRKHTGTRRAASPQSSRVRIRHPRSARTQHRRQGVAARRQRQGQLRQQRRRSSGLAQLHQPVRLRRARGGARGDRQPEGARRDDDLRRRRQHGDLAAAERRSRHWQAAASHRRHALRHARRLHRRTQFPGGRRVRAHDRRHGARARSAADGVREHGDRAARRPGVLSHDDRRGRGTQGDRSDARSRG